MLPSVLIFLIVLSLLVFIHEWGHFLAAKLNGIKVEEFGFGYPPRIWGKKIGETVYSLNWVPFGGFVRLLGQESQARKRLSLQEQKRAFFSQSKRARATVLLAGILGNFLLGVACFSLIYSKIGIPQQQKQIKILAVVKDSPAARAGLKKDDLILAINGQRVESLAVFLPLIEKNKGKKVQLTIKNNQERLVWVRVRENPPANEGRLGVAVTDVKMVFYPWWQMPFLGAWQGLKEALGWGMMIVGAIGLSLKQLLAGIAPAVAGPVGIFQLTRAAAKQGFLELVQFVGILSINLAVLNLLPIPALDGGHLLFVFVGDLLGAKRKEKVERAINLIGFVFLISLMIIVTLNDLVRLFEKTALFSFFSH